MLVAGRVALLAYDPGVSTQNIGAATGTITLSGVAGAITPSGSTSIGASVGTVTLTGVAGAISSAGSLTIGGVVGTVTLTGVAGAITLVTVVIGTVQYRFGRARKSYEFGKITKEPT